MGRKILPELSMAAGLDQKVVLNGYSAGLPNTPHIFDEMAVQAVGSDTFDMTPAVSIWFSSSSTCGRKGKVPSP